MLVSEVKPKEVLEELRGKYGETASFKYCELVFSGNARAGNKTKLGCKRFLRDLKLSEEGESNYKFDVGLANALEDLGLELPDPTTRKPFTAALFQLYIFQQLAWLNKDTGFRRFTKMYISLGRKQGKSLIVAFMIVYEFLYGEVPEFEREIVITSRSEDQAKKIFDQLTTILSIARQNSPRLNKRLKLGVGVITDLESGSTITYYSSDPNKIDSTNPVLGVIDEYAEANKGKEMYDRIESGMMYQKNGLMIRVSTVSENLNSPMYEDYLFCDRVLSDKVSAEDEFIYIAELDSDTEWRDKENWSKSAPLLLEEGFRDVAMARIESSVKKAEDSGNMNALLSKTFNRWVRSSTNKYIDYSAWEGAIEENANIRGKRVHVGIDLSDRGDLTSIGFILEDGERLYIDGHSFVANMAYTGEGRRLTYKALQESAELEMKKKSARDEFDYLTAEKLGHITICKGTIDYKEVINYITRYVAENDLELVGVYYDPWGMERFADEMKVLGVKFKLIEVRQVAPVVTEPIKEFRVNLMDGYIKHSNNSVVNYAIKNAEVVEQGGGLKITKPNTNLKIDPLDCLINAYTDLIVYSFEEGIGKQSKLSKLEEALKTGGFFG